jgi:pimeloyl-ACP methyl ester carboxylesterase
VLSGSSGRVEAERCRVLASAGATALSMRWFGGAGQPASVDRVPLETFDDALATLHERCERLVVVGSSRGAEVALLLGALHPEIDAVVGLAPSSVVWAALSGERPQRSSWTLAGEPLPFVPYDDEWDTDTEPPEYVGLYRRSLEKYADRVPAARLPVERIAGDVLLVAGGDDRVWPAVDFAADIAQRRGAHALATRLVTHDPAGHRVVLPGEQPAAGGARMARGGTDDADAELGRLAWPEVLRALGLAE